MTGTIDKIRSEIEYHKSLLRLDLRQVEDPHNSESLKSLFQKQADRNAATIEKLELQLKELLCTDVPHVEKPKQPDQSKSKSSRKRVSVRTKTRSAGVKLRRSSSRKAPRSSKK